MTEHTVKPGSKRALSIAVMNANLDKPMHEVVPLIEKAADLKTPAAKSMYKWLVENGLAGGKVEKAPRAPKAEKEAKVKEPKADKPAKTPKTEKVKETQRSAPKAVKAEKTPDEIEAIKAKNLARLKEVGKKYEKYAKGQIAENINLEHSEGWQGEEAARALIEQEDIGGLTSFQSPEHLTMDEVKALV